MAKAILAGLAATSLALVVAHGMLVYRVNSLLCYDHTRLDWAHCERVHRIWPKFDFSRLDRGWRHAAPFGVNTGRENPL